MDEQLIKVGSYKTKTDDTNDSIDREYYEQGFIVKDEEAFLHHPEMVCYIPELSDSTYTHQDFLILCNNQESFAKECFYSVDWQHPETWIDEQFEQRAWGWCPHCKEIYDMSDGEHLCPNRDRASSATKIRKTRKV